MPTIPVPGQPQIAVALNRRRGVRRLTLRVSALDGRVTLTCPVETPDRTLRKFLTERAGWIASTRADLPGHRPVAPGLILPVEGQATTVVEGGPRAALTDTGLSVPTTGAGPAAAGLLRSLARRRLKTAADRHAGQLGRRYSRLTLRDTRSRWGSCSAAGNLNFSWRLILAPPEILDYLAAHEVAHLAHMDHSAAFWTTLADLYGDSRDARRWLRAEGPNLHRYDFA